jgi:tRNA A-37 threonylcarbamoyl transferase component Bud32
VSTLDGGRRVGRYRIVRFLGAGAMGEVYLAEDPHIERRLAIKTVRLAGGRPQDIEDRKKRLLREARAAGRLLHPNVVTLFDTGEEDGLLYLAFEFVEGCDLATRLETGEPPTLREVLRIVRQVADALDYAHRQGIVHRDIKPSNILIDLTGHVKVADFGIAKVTGQNTELTVVGSVMGSPQYLSPEQIRGDELDGRSDIFSLGVVLYELLSGRRPFDGETITTLVYQILHKDASISELRAVPLRLEQLLHRMLAKDRGDRLATAGMVAEELAAIERELPEATLSAPAAPAAEVLDATRVLPSRAIAPDSAEPAGSAGGAATPPSGLATAPAAAAPGVQPATGPAVPVGMPVPPISPASLAGPAGAAPSIAVAAATPVAPAAPVTSPAATAPVRRSSNTKAWVALAAMLLVLGGALATGAFWFWQRYLRRASPEVGQLVQPGPPPAAPSSPAAGSAGTRNAGSGAAAGSAGSPPGAATGPSGSAGGTASQPAEHAGVAAPQLPSGAERPMAPAAPTAPIAKPSPVPATRTAAERRAAAAGIGGGASGSGRAGDGDGAAAENGSRPRSGKLPASDAGTTGDVAGGAAPPTAAGGSAPEGAGGARSGASGSKNASGSTAKGRVESIIADAGISHPAAGERAAVASPGAPGGPAPDAVDRVVHSGLELAFRVDPPDAFVLLDGAVIGRAQEWNGQQGGRSYTLPGSGQHLVKIKKPGMKDYRIAVEASAMRGTTPVVVSLQPLPAAQVETSDLQTVRVREAIALHVQPEVNALLLVDGATVGPVKKFAGRFGHADEWLSLPLGMHRLTLVAPGYGRRDVAVEVSPGADKARQKVDVALSPATGTP